MSIVVEDIPTWGPYWVGPGFGGGMGIQAPTEVPLAAKEAKIEGGPPRSGRQMLINGGFAGAYGVGGLYGGVGEITDSNSLSQTSATQRAVAGMASTYLNYRMMRCDGIVAIGREIADCLICSNLWTYEPAEGEDAEELAEMIEEVKGVWEGRGSSGDSHEGFSLREYFLSESCRAKDYGNHTMEVAWELDDEGRMCFSEFLPLLPETTRPLVYDGTRRFAGVRNWGINKGEVDLDPDYCVRFIYDGEGGDLFGRSRFENCKDWIQLKFDLREKLREDVNITIGNTPVVRYPMDRTSTQNTMTAQQNAGTINAAIRRGFGVTIPGFSVDEMIAMTRNGIDPSKVYPWEVKRLETGQNAMAGFEAAFKAVDNQILFGLLTLPRTVAESKHGSRADAEEHTDSMVMMAWRWITYVVGIANNLNDSLMEQRYGRKYRGRVVIKATPISDESKSVLKAIFTALLGNADFAVKIIDIAANLQKIGIKTRDGFNQDELAKQMAAKGVADALSGREKLKTAGYKDDEVDKIQKQRAEEDVVPTDDDKLIKAMADEVPHQYSTVQIQLDEIAADCVRIFGSTIPDEELASDGREKDIHVTLKYGLHTDDPTHVAAVLNGIDPVEYTVGKTSLFRSPAYDVLKLDVGGKGLHDANRTISNALMHTDTYPEYNPHVTIAYLKPGMGDKYVNKTVISNEKRTADGAVFSSRSGNRSHLKFSKS